MKEFIVRIHYIFSGEKMLINELKLLCEKGLIAKKQYPEVPPRVEYSLTPLGEKVLRLWMKFPDSEWKICESYSNGTLCYMHAMRKQVIYLRQVLLLMHSSR
ncbi:winged helix-turn-helix transcriptional regulator [Segatella oris]|uniref:winged helix-turn-helix transcriptional regulator n=1 Tax=Segatella oris TaxID=28135 RepID=UPI003872AFBA